MNGLIIIGNSPALAQNYISNGQKHFYTKSAYYQMTKHCTDNNQTLFFHNNLANYHQVLMQIPHELVKSVLAQAHREPAPSGAPIDLRAEQAPSMNIHPDMAQAIAEMLGESSGGGGDDEGDGGSSDRSAAGWGDGDGEGFHNEEKSKEGVNWHSVSKAGKSHAAALEYGTEWEW
jgi:hypothetical protein